MKKNLILGINSKFVHTNLAIRYIKNYVEKYSDVKIDLLERTINNSIGEIISDIFRYDADKILISTYIWNKEYVFKLIKEFKKIKADTQIILGGPEVSYKSIELMEENKDIDIIIQGEGEETALELFTKENLADIEGIVYRENKKIISTGERKPLCDLDKIPFPYTDEELKEKGKILYYESSRGCPFKCSYCMSSLDKNVRYFSNEKVEKDLKTFIDAGVSLVKFVDRTYNLHKDRYMKIWKFLLEEYRENLTFHFEISADLFDDEAIEFLKKVPNGYFQFEIGVQTINPLTMELINRKNHLEKLKKNVLSIKDNIHLHLDLIAGLPHEDYNTFKDSFDYVHELKPEMIQLGFLKILEGTQISKEIEKYNYKYLSFPPYEILENAFISYEEILKLKDFEQILDYYYNSEKFKESTKYIINNFYKRPFDFYEELALYYRNNNYMGLGHKPLAIFNFLYDFYLYKKFPNLEIFTQVLKYDYIFMEKPKHQTYWLERNIDKDLYHNLALKVEGRSLREKYKNCELELFTYDIFTGKLRELKLFFEYTGKTLVEEIKI